MPSKILSIVIFRDPVVYDFPEYVKPAIMPINTERATREISVRARMRTEEYFCNQFIAEMHQDPE